MTFIQKTEDGTEVNLKEDFKAVYKAIYPNVTIDLSCVGCVLQYLNYLVSWYERESKPTETATDPLHTLRTIQPTTPLQSQPKRGRPRGSKNK